MTQYAIHSVRMEPHVRRPLASVTALQAGEASTVTPPVLQGPGARTVPGNVTALIMESATTVSTISPSCHLARQSGELLKNYYLAITYNYNLSLSACLSRLSGA